MKTKLLHETDGARTWALIFDTGDEVMDGLSGFAREEGLDAASFTGIGALSDVKLGYFDWDEKDYLEIPLDEQVEVLTLAGDVAVSDEGPQVQPTWSWGSETARRAAGTCSRRTSAPRSRSS